MNIFAYIPARGGSKRIPRKNVRALGGKPVLSRVIANLSAAGLPGIAVSTEDDEIAAVAARGGAVTLAPRSAHLADAETAFVDLVREDLPRYAEHFGTNYALFVLATAGLVPSNIYAEAIRIFAEKKPALLLGVTRFPITPFWALVRRDGETGWKPLFPKEVVLPSHKLPETCVDAGLFFLLDLTRTRHLRSLLDADPLEVFEIPPEIAVDVDTEDDWTELERRYAERAP